MAVKIRLTRIGRTHAPVYRIVATDSRNARNGKCIEILGTYNPLNHQFVQYHEARIQDWLAKGAIATDAVKKLMKSYKAPAA